MHQEREVSAVVATPAVQYLPTQKRLNFFECTPQEQVTQATEIANVLSSVIEKQGLFTLIQGKKYIRAEGWQTLGTFLGVVPREKSVVRQEDGSYEAYVEIVKFKDGTIVGGGSALCSRKEKRWGSADEYAVRSMAITRATGKAFRVGFSWIVTLAGYQPTPEEEIPQAVVIPTVATDKKEKKLYTGTTEQQQLVSEVLKKQNIDESLWPTIHERMMNRPSKDLPEIIKGVLL